MFWSGGGARAHCVGWENAFDPLSVIRCTSHSPSLAQAEEGHLEEGRRRRVKSGISQVKPTYWMLEISRASRS
ncbi:hypothetical protein AMELA_G00197790 [Ameiurus melas]|uniref:Uncharacterized protein n=1 Tax=Ameiurus melas TaxID=219545 RepID=A0A7J6A8I3_AMEME|nr:hypothetical protein AMELA_G00197790 [Ameiurus melas]